MAWLGSAQPCMHSHKRNVKSGEERDIAMGSIFCHIKVLESNFLVKHSFSCDFKRLAF